MGEQSYNVEKRPELVFTSIFRLLHFLNFCSLIIIINFMKKHLIKCTASPRRDRLGEFGVALLEVIYFGYKTPGRCRIENTKWFWLTSRSRSSF